MYFCFVIEDIMGLENTDPLILQVKYAQYLGVDGYCNMSDHTVVDRNKNLLDVEGKHIFLRATCERMLSACDLLSEKGAVLLENTSDITTIEHWEFFISTERQIFSLSENDIYDAAYTPEIRDFLAHTSQVFVKSRKKGFHAYISSQRLLNPDEEILLFFRENSRYIKKGLMVSERVGVKKDSLGKKESRYFVIGGEIINSSRMLHSVKHTVPASQIKKASDIVKKLSLEYMFPKNYVLDIGEFKINGEYMLDIVEINPITSALCYVNNSIFTNMAPIIENVYKRTGMGAEYCMDALEYPEHYVQRRSSNVCYEYTHEDSYYFLNEQT